MSGWIKLHRQIVNSSKFADPDILRLWILCLTKASHKETIVVIDKREVPLTPGQFITGRYSLHQDYNALLSPRKKIPETTLWNWLKRLESWGDLDIKTTNKYSVVTVLKWDDYQEGLTANGQQIDSRLTANGQQIDTNKNVKNLKNDKKEEIKDIGPPNDSPTPTRFIPPTIEQVMEYCQERNNDVDPNKWLDHYTSKGWIVGKAKMKDWKAAVRTWERNDYGKGRVKHASGGGSVKDPYAGVDFGF